MSTPIPAPSRHENYLARHPVSTYFALTFVVSWLGAFAVAARIFCAVKPSQNLPA